MAQHGNTDTPAASPLPVITKDSELLQYGICRAPIPSKSEHGGIDCAKWAAELSQVMPLHMAFEGDGEYAFYRNILDEPDFPFDAVLNSEIGKCILEHFGVSTLDELRLDDAFCVHYNMEQDDTSGAKHTDPSDITVNMCLEKTDDVQGSQVLFYGSKALDGHVESSTTSTSFLDSFLVDQVQGTATIHWGAHAHETTSLKCGKRTNIILTYCYADPDRSDAMSRTCYL